MLKILRQTSLLIFLWNLFGFANSLCAQIKDQTNQDVYVYLEELSADKIDSKKNLEETQESTLLPQESYQYFGCLQSTIGFIKPEKKYPSCLSERPSFKVGKKDFLFLTSGTSPPTLHLN